MDDKFTNVSKPINELIEKLEFIARDMVARAPGIVVNEWVTHLNDLHDNRQSIIEQIRKRCKDLSRYAEDKELERKALENDLAALKEAAQTAEQESALKITQLTSDRDFYKSRFIP